MSCSLSLISRLCPLEDPLASVGKLSMHETSGRSKQSKTFGCGDLTHYLKGYTDCTMTTCLIPPLPPEDFLAGAEGVVWKVSKTRGWLELLAQDGALWAEGSELIPKYLKHSRFPKLYPSPGEGRPETHDRL